MSKTILEGFKFAVDIVDKKDENNMFMALHLLRWCYDLLSKGYSVNDNLDDLLDKYEYPKLVPEKE